MNKKILFFSLPFLGHINPNMNLLVNLSKKYDICCVSSKKYTAIFRDKGINMLEYPDSIYEYYGNGIIKDDKNIVRIYYASQFNSADLSYINRRSIKLLEEVWFELGESIKDFAPDLILNDAYAFWGGPIANRINVRYINVDSATDMKSSVQDIYFKQYIKEVIEKETKLHIDINDVIKEINMINRKQRNKFLKFSHKSSAEYKKPLMTLAHMSKSLQVGADDMESPYTYIGFDLEQDFEKDIEKVKQNMIYISRGTINDSYNEKIMKDIISIFEDEKKYEVVATCGVRADTIDVFKNEYIRIHSLINQIEYLQKSKLFISHGGITGVREAIICETPIIIFPTTFHCYQVGLAIEQLNVGIMLHTHPLSTGELKKAIEKVLHNEKFNVNIKKLKEELTLTKKENSMCEIIENNLK